MILRRLVLADMGEAARMYRAAYDERFPFLAGRHSSDDDLRYFRKSVFAHEEIWGALVDDALVGIVTFRPEFVDKLYVLPARQRRGIGSSLLDIPKRAHERLQLWTFQRNADARRFYESQGFRAIRETDGSGTEEREPDVLYTWSRA